MGRNLVLLMVMLLGFAEGCTHYPQNLEPDYIGIGLSPTGNLLHDFDPPPDERWFTYRDPPSPLPFSPPSIRTGLIDGESNRIEVARTAQIGAVSLIEFQFNKATYLELIPEMIEDVREGYKRFNKTKFIEGVQKYNKIAAGRGWRTLDPMDVKARVTIHYYQRNISENLFRFSKPFSVTFPPEEVQRVDLSNLSLGSWTDVRGAPWL